MREDSLLAQNRECGSGLYPDRSLVPSVSSIVSVDAYTLHGDQGDQVKGGTKDGH